VQGVFSDQANKPIVHDNDSYSAFVAELLQKVGISEAERVSLQEQMAATPVARAGGGPGGGVRTSASSTVADEVLSQAGAYTRSLLSSTSAVSVTRKHP
jgi:hypothetical protein